MLNLMKYFIAILIFFASGYAIADGAAAESFKEAPCVLVSIAPHKFFVERIAGDTVRVQLMVPAGASAHTYEPMPQQILSAGKADIWFFLGEAFEGRAMAGLRAHHPNIAFYDMRQGVDMISDPNARCSCHAGGSDPHIWLSARQAKIQAETIAKVLAKHYPEHAEAYSQALKNFKKSLSDLDSQIEAALLPLENRTLLVSHPAYAYLCRDYNLTQLSIEFEGKDPTPRQMTKVLNQARAAKIKRVFVQPQYSNKGAKLFAAELGCEVVTLDPYSENFMTAMLDIANQFSKN